MILMNKVEITAYRYLGSTGACFTAFQAFGWLWLSLAGALCKYTGCGSTSSKGTFKYCFYLTYYYEPQNMTGNFTRVNYVNPTSFHVIMWVNVLMCIANLAISLLTAKAFIKWKDTKEIRKMARIWTISILIFSFIELIMCVTFASDIVSIMRKEEVKCFLNSNLTSLRSSETIARTPAPYLLQLSSNLKTMKKKIRKFKRNLLFLDAVFDENSPDYVKNPFISKTVVNSYVEDIWKDMFNNSIREKVRRKSDTIPFDEVMKNFVIDEHLDLDDMDYDLLKNFDGLTNNKWIKPIESSNVVFGKPFNLSTSVTANDSTELDKIASLLHEYLKDTETQKTNYSQADQNFDEFFKKLLEELEEQEIHFAHNKEDKVEILDTIKSNDTEDILLSLTKFFDNMVLQKENQDGNEYIDNNQNKETIKDNIKELPEYNNKTLEFGEDQFFDNVKESLNFHYEFDKIDEDLELPDLLKFDLGSNISAKLFNLTNNNLQGVKFLGNKTRKQGDPEPPPPPKPTTKKTTTATKEPYKNDYIKEICENCAYFILAPSIVCLIMSLKVIVAWFLNITVAVLVIYYGSKVKLKKRNKFLPCCLTTNE